MVNPLAAFREGYDLMQGFRDNQARQQAGNALAGGDYRGGANALLQNGMLSQGMDVRQAGAAQDKARQERESALKAEGFKLMLDGEAALSSVPLEQRRAVLNGQVIPLLQARGAPAELLQQLQQLPDDGLSDQGLQVFRQALGGELQKVQAFQSGGQVTGVDPQTGQQRWQAQVGPEQPPAAPAGYRWNGSNMEFIPGGPADPRVRGGLAAAGRAPPRPRARAAGGAPGAAPSQTYSDVPPGAVVVR
jgi:hypothetical protein